MIVLAGTAMMPSRAQKLSAAWSPEAPVAFTLSMDGQPWLTSPGVFLDGSSSIDGGLVLTATVTSVGADALGEFEATTHKWAFQAAPQAEVFWTSLLTYAGDEGALEFVQFFPEGLGQAEVGDLSARSLFPAFHTTAAGPATACFAYHGTFPAMEPCTLDTYAESHQGGSPFVLYDSVNTSLPMVVLSPLSSPKAQHMAVDKRAGVLGAGVKASATAIPKGFTQTFLLSAGYGIGSGMEAWGERLRQVSGRPKADKYLDVTHSSIGFWTDNGGYYHYSTGTNATATYEEVANTVLLIDLSKFDSVVPKSLLFGTVTPAGAAEGEGVP